MAIEDAELLDWLEEAAKASSTGISFDWIPPVDGEPSGFRFMRRFFIGDARKSLREAIKAARARHNDGASIASTLREALKAAEFAMEWAQPHLDADPITEERGINEAHTKALEQVRAALAKATA